MAATVSSDALSEVLDKSSTARKSSEPRQYKRFVWDVILRYVSVLGVTLVAVGLGEEFFLERGLACNTPNYVNRDQYAFVVVWCSRNVRLVDLLPLLILIQSLCILGPQEVWEIYVSSSLQQFFSLSPRLKRLRDKKTGNYDVDTARVVRHLCEKYTDRHVLHRSYWMKLLFQMTVTYAFFILLLALYDGGSKFQLDFICSQVGSLYIPPSSYNYTSSERFKPFDAECTYTTAEAFFPIWVADLVLVFVGGVTSSIGAIWLQIHHWAELDHKGRCDYYYSMAMNAGDYNPKRYHKGLLKVKDDLGFLVLMLFNLDRGQGESFYEVQVELNLQDRWSDDYEAYNNYVTRLTTSPNHTATAVDEIRSVIAELGNKDSTTQCLLGLHLLRVITTCAFTDRVPAPFERTLHLFCGSRGCTIAIAKLSKHTYAVDFNKFCHLTVSSTGIDDYEDEGESETRHDAPTENEAAARSKSDTEVVREEQQAHCDLEESNDTGLQRRGDDAVRAEGSALISGGSRRSLPSEHASESSDIQSRADISVPQQESDDAAEDSPHSTSNKNIIDDKQESQAQGDRRHCRAEIIEEHFQQIIHFRVPIDITSKTGQECKLLTKKLNSKSLDAEEHPRLERYDLIVVTCMETRFRVSTARVVLEDVFLQTTNDECLIVACAFKPNVVCELMEPLLPFCHPCPINITDQQEEDEAINGCFRCPLELGRDGEECAQVTGACHKETFTCSAQKVNVFFKAVRFDKKAYKERTSGDV